MSQNRTSSLAAIAFVALLAGASLAVPAPAAARDPSTASEALSSLSLLPVASVTAAASVVSAAGASVVIAPAVLLSTATDWLLVSAQASAAGTVWILERAGDGARLVARFTANRHGDLHRLSSVGSGHTLRSTPVANGWLIGHGDAALAFVPRSPERAHFHHERLN